MAKLHKALLICLCLLLPGGPLAAASVQTAAPEKTAARPEDITRIDTGVSGTTVWLRKDTTQSLVALAVQLPAGSAYDPVDKSGLAALAAQLLSNGALLSSRLGNKLVASPEVRFHATATRDTLEISLLAPANKIAALSKILGQALSQPRISSRAIADTRLELMQSLEDRDQIPSEHAEDLLYSFYFGTHGYGHTVPGSKAALATIHHHDVLQFIRNHWVRGRIAVAISGDADADAAKKIVTNIFGELPAANVPAIPRPGYTGAPGLHHIAMPVPQPAAIIALPGLRTHDSNLLAAQIAAFILGGHDGARLNHSLRDRHLLTDNARARLIPLNAAGLTTVTLQSAPRDMREALSRLRQVLRRYALEGPTNTEFSDAKRWFRDSRALAFASEAASARVMANRIRDGWSIADMQSYAERIAHLSLSEVRRMANRLYRSEDLTIVVLGPLPKAEHSSNPYRK